MNLREIGWKGVHWMHAARDRDLLRALVNTVRNLRFDKRQGIFSLFEWLLASHGLFSMGLVVNGDTI
jgi:hypothetical protein